MGEKTIKSVTQGNTQLRVKLWLLGEFGRDFVKKMKIELCPEILKTYGKKRNLPPQLQLDTPHDHSRNFLEGPSFWKSHILKNMLPQLVQSSSLTWGKDDKSWNILSQTEKQFAE